MLRKSAVVEKLGSHFEFKLHDVSIILDDKIDPKVEGCIERLKKRRLELLGLATKTVLAELVRMVVNVLPGKTDGVAPAENMRILLGQVESEPWLTHARVVMLKVLADRCGLYTSFGANNELSVVNPVDDQYITLSPTLIASNFEETAEWKGCEGFFDALDHLHYSEDAFVIGERLYKGNTASIYKCQLLGEECAAKVFLVDEMVPEKIAACVRELSLMRELCSKKDVRGIVRYFGYNVRNVHPRRVVVLMELAGRPLAALNAQLALQGELLSGDVTFLSSLFADILHGLSYLHSSGVIHRDLKGANILLSSGGSSAEIADFGLAKKLAPSKAWATKPVGSARWMAPEVSGGGYATWRSDIWSFGMTLLESLTGRLPYHDILVLDVPTAIRNQLLPAMPWLRTNSDSAELNTLHQMVHACLQFDPLLRPSAEELIKYIAQ